MRKIILTGIISIITIAFIGCTGGENSSITKEVQVNNDSYMSKNNSEEEVYLDAKHINKVETENNEKSKLDKSDEVNQIAPMTNSYSNTSIKFDYPSNWTFVENPTEDILYVKFTDSNLGTEPVFEFSTGEAWLTDFERTVEEYKVILSRSYSNVVIKELIKTTINNHDAIKLVFTGMLQDKEYTIIQHEVIVGYSSFRFKYKLPTTMVNTFENTLELIVSSIEFI